jgi:hypothetical protein
MRNTTEKLAMTNGATPGEHEVHKLDSGLFIRKGPDFHEKFMAGIYVHRRSEIAMMLIASDIQKHGIDALAQATDDVRAKVMDDIWSIADDFILAERRTLDKRMNDYWNFFMASDKNTDEVMAAMVDESQDWSA